MGKKGGQGLESYQKRYECQLCHFLVFSTWTFINFSHLSLIIYKQETDTGFLQTIYEIISTDTWSTNANSVPNPTLSPSVFFLNHLHVPWYFSLTMTDCEEMD